MDKNPRLGVIDLVNDGLGTSSVGTEVDLYGDVIEDEVSGMRAGADCCQEEGKEEY